MIQVVVKMNFIKIILIVIGILTLFVAGYWLIGIISAVFWLLLVAGIVGAIGYGGYKLFFEKDKAKAQIEDKTPIAIADLKDADRALEEYKRKYLPK